MTHESQPISAVHWIDRRELKPNNYNPNRVAKPELNLLKISILEDGWTQPIVANTDNEIVDGFHRWTVSADQEISDMTNGKIPVVFTKPNDDSHQKMSTIRHNRARGTHAVLDMAEIMFARNIPRYIKAFKAGEYFAKRNLKTESELNG